MAPPPTTRTGVSCPPAAPADVSVPAAEKKQARRTEKRRRWTDKLGRKIVGAVRPSSRRTAPAPVEEPPRSDFDADAEKRRLRRELRRRRRREMEEVFRLLEDDDEKQSLEQELAECQATRCGSTGSGGQALQTKDSTPNDVNGVAEDVNPDGSPDKGVMPAAAATEETESPTPVELPPFPIGVLDKPPKSVRTFRPRAVPAFPTPVTADAEESQDGEEASSKPIDDVRDLVEQWSELIEIAERQRRRRRPPRRWGGPALQKDGIRPNDDGDGDGDGAEPEPEAVINLDARPKEDILNVRSAVPAATEEEEVEMSPIRKLVELISPIGVVDERPPPKSVRTFRPKKVPLPPSPTHITAAAAGAEKSQDSEASTTLINRDLVDRWSKVKEIVERQARLRRALRLEKQAEPNGSRPNDDGEDGAAAEAVVSLDARPDNAILEVPPAVAATEDEEEEELPSPTRTLVELIFPIGFVRKPASARR